MSSDIFQSVIAVNWEELNSELNGKVSYSVPVDGAVYFRYSVKVSGLGEHTLRVECHDSKGFPFKEPDLYVQGSALFTDSDGNSLYAQLASHDLHILKSYRDYEVRICHKDPVKGWSLNDSILTVFLKGALWLKAYKGYKDTGKPISDFFYE